MAGHFYVNVVRNSRMRNDTNRLSITLIVLVALALCFVIWSKTHPQASSSHEPAEIQTQPAQVKPSLQLQ